MRAAVADPNSLLHALDKHHGIEGHENSKTEKKQATKAKKKGGFDLSGGWKSMSLSPILPPLFFCTLCMQVCDDTMHCQHTP